MFGRNGAAMPAWGGNLTDAEILGVVCHERYDLGGADPRRPSRPSSTEWCAEESEIFADLEAGRRHPHARAALPRHHPDRRSAGSGLARRRVMAATRMP